MHFMLVLSTRTENRPGKLAVESRQLVHKMLVFISRRQSKMKTSLTKDRYYVYKNCHQRNFVQM